MNYRDYLQQLIYKIINPLIRGMIKIGITPNFITTTGFILNVVAAGMFVYAGIYGGQNDLAIIGWAGGVILFAGLFDMMDGRVARLGNMSSKFGALYDSVLDRYSELMTFFGICYYLSMKDYFLYALIAFVALIGSLMVSYVRARAEGLGIECKVGFMQSRSFVLWRFQRYHRFRTNPDYDCSSGFCCPVCQYHGICSCETLLQSDERMN